MSPSLIAEEEICDNNKNVVLTSVHVDQNPLKHQIEFRGRIVDPDVWISLVANCHYLPENQMITLCNM